MDLSLTKAFHFMVERRFEILEQTQEHLVLTLTALFFACLISIPLGVVLTRMQRSSGPIIAGVGVIQTIPSIALLGFLLPVFGIGFLPAVIALFLYALLPIVRNTFAGIEGVDPAVRDAARGMGMTDWQVLYMVELPLAAPVILAGIRTATVINVGVATLCALIASGGLGEFIFRGIALNNSTMLLAGALPAAVLALVLDGLLGAIEKARHTGLTLLVVLVLIALGASTPIWNAFTGDSEQPLKAGFVAEFMERPDGWAGLREAYGLELNTVDMDAALMYSALREGRVDVISGYLTDGRIEEYDLRVLEDDKEYFPPYYAAPLIRTDLVHRHPEIESVLSQLAGTISPDRMRELNLLVDSEEMTAPEAAAYFLKEAFGITPSPPRRKGRVVRIGSKNFTEQIVLGHILELFIETKTGLETETRLGLGGTKLCFDALTEGEIDLYPEYTGTALMVLLKHGQEKLSQLGSPEAVYRFTKRELNERFNLTFLEPFEFNNSYGLLMREGHADRLDIRSISELVEHLEKH